MKFSILLLLILPTTAPLFAAEATSTAATAINALGVDLLHKTARPDANALISPYSIQSALAMTYAGADGATREEMMAVLHYPTNDTELHRSFATLQKELNGVMQRSAEAAEKMKRYGATNDPITLTVANRLFGQQSYEFRATFLSLVKENYGAPVELMDFHKDAAGATKHINNWVEQQTRQRIRNLIPDGALNELTRLVLVNAIYLKAPWAEKFHEEATKPQPFHIDGGATVNVPTMMEQQKLSYARREGFSIVVIPYSDWNIQFVILLPDKTNDLAALENKLNPSLFAECANLPTQEIIVHLPKFKLEPPMIPLSKQLQELGMKTAFDKPADSANFDRMAPRRLNDYLYISEVFHKTFLNLDENGTEAAAATAVVMNWKADIEPAKPIEVHVDHPFIFAIQHRPSGACLFLGHVTDPR
jgi:serpin B